VTVVVSSPSNARKVAIRVMHKHKSRTQQEGADEEIQLFMGAGDAYEMDGTCTPTATGRRVLHVSFLTPEHANASPLYFHRNNAGTLRALRSKRHASAPYDKQQSHRPCLPSWKRRALHRQLWKPCERPVSTKLQQQVQFRAYDFLGRRDHILESRCIADWCPLVSASFVVLCADY
jgi:hypothetical protein